MATSASPAEHASPGTSRGDVLVVVDAPWRPSDPLSASVLSLGLAGAVDGRKLTVLVPAASGEVGLVEPGDPREARDGGSLAGVARGIGGPSGLLLAALREADRRDAAAVALLSGGPREDGAQWVGTLLEPILGGSYEVVYPAYDRGRLEGMLSTALVYPLTRALYGLRLRQPSGGEAALSLALARDLLQETDWRRDPYGAGTDAWLVAEVLAERRRVCQAWIGQPPAPREMDASQAIATLVGPVFREMERRAERWQRIEGSVPVPSFGRANVLADDPARLDVSSFVATFLLGMRELEAIWGLVLPPATRLALRRVGADARELHLGDSLWARIVYDFAVAWTTRPVERHQLLASLTPLYLGWVAGFVNDVRGADAAATDARIESLCAAFEVEKPYLIRRWRWPDSFSP